MSPDSSEEVAQHFHARPKQKVSTALKSRPQQRPVRGGFVAPLTAENLDSKNAKVATMIERNKFLQAAAHFDGETGKKSPRRRVGEQMAVVDGNAKDSAAPTLLYPAEKMNTTNKRNPVFETRPVRRPGGDGTAVVSRDRGPGGRRHGEIKNNSKTISPNTAPVEGRRASSSDGICGTGGDIAEALSSTASVTSTTGSNAAATMVTKQSVVGRKHDGSDSGGGDGGDQQLLAWLNEVLCLPATGGIDSTEKNR